MTTTELTSGCDKVVDACAPWSAIVRARRPGGYQVVGRTTQVWNHCHPGNAPSFEPGTPWLLRYFDRISFYPVSADELMHLRAEMAAGRGESRWTTESSHSPTIAGS